MKNKKAFELDTIMTFIQGILFVVMVIWLVLFTSQARPERSEEIGLQVLSEKYPDERNLLYLTDDNGYKLTDLIGRELLLGGNITLQGDYSAIMQDTYPTVFESPFYGISNSRKTCPYPNPIPAGYDSIYNVSHVNISDYTHCYVVPKKLGRLFSYPLDLQKTYEMANTGTRIVSVWAENNKIYYSKSWNKGYDWTPPAEIGGSDDGYLPLVANDSTTLYVTWLKVRANGYIDLAYVTSAMPDVVMWSGVTTFDRPDICSFFSPVNSICDNQKAKDYVSLVRQYVDECERRPLNTLPPPAATCQTKNIVKLGYSYSNLPSVFKDKKDYTYYLSKIEPRYRIDLSYDDGITKAETTYGSEDIGGLVRESAQIEFAPPAGFEGAIKMRLTTQ